MTQHDYSLDNQLGSQWRADLNNALLAIQSSNSAGTEPATRVAGMLWFDTDDGTLWLRNRPNNDWLKVASGGPYLPLTGGTITGNLAVAGLFSNPDFDKARVSYAGKTAPTSPFEGQLWYNTTPSPPLMKIYHSGAWLDVVDLTSPVFNNQVIVNATGNAMLNLTAAGERRRITSEEAGNRFAFYNPSDAATAYITDAGDLLLGALGGGSVVDTLASKQASFGGQVPIQQYDGTLIQVGGYPAHIYVGGVDKGEISVGAPTPPLFQAKDLGSLAYVQVISGAKLTGGAQAAGTLFYWSGTTVVIGVGTWRSMDGTDDTLYGHRVA